MQDHDLLRYARHILLDPPIGIDGQTRLLHTHVLIVGCGGLGCAVALYLAASGIETLTLVDPDRVELSNLQRQIGHTTDSIGQLKVNSLAQRCLAINPGIRVNTHPVLANAHFLETQLEAPPVVSLVIDACDNFDTRQTIDAVCWAHCIPWIMGAAMGLQGQVGVFDYRVPHAKGLRRYSQLFPPDEPPSPNLTCTQGGVLGPLVGLVGCAQATQALRLLLENSKIPMAALSMSKKNTATTPLEAQTAHMCNQASPQLWCINGWTLQSQSIY